MTSFMRPVIIVDDQRKALEHLRRLLKTDYPDFEIIGEFENTESALPIIESGEVEGVFLDIQIQEEGDAAGLELGERISLLPPEKRPWIIYVTDHDHHAYKAHKSLPIGFLRKGPNSQEFNEVILKVRERFPKFIALKYRTDKTADGQTLDHSGSRLLYPTAYNYLNIDNIVYINSEPERNSPKQSPLPQRIYLNNNSEIKNVINSFQEEWLAIPYFIRIHKHTIVNLNYVAGYRNDILQKDQSWAILEASLAKELRVSENYVSEFKAALKKFH